MAADRVERDSRIALCAFVFAWLTIIGANLLKAFFGVPYMPVRYVLHAGGIFALVGCLLWVASRYRNSKSTSRIFGLIVILSIVAKIIDIRSVRDGVVNFTGINIDTAIEGNVYATIAMLIILAMMRLLITSGQAQARATANEARYKALVDNAPFGMCELDGDGRLQSVNAAGLRMTTGSGRDDVSQLSFVELVPEADRERVTQLLRQAAQGKPSSFQSTIATRSESRDISGTVIPITHADSATAKMMVVLQDITDQRNAESALRASEARFRAIAETMPVPFSVTSVRTGKIVFTNERFRLLFGEGDESMIGRDVRDLYADRADRDRLLEQLERDGSVREFEVQAQMSNGKRLWVSASVDLVSWDEEPLLFSAFYEISERRRIEDELRGQTEFNNMLINSSIDGILAFDRECRYTVWNPALEQASGIKQSDCVGQSAFDVFPFIKEFGEDEYFYETLKGNSSIVKDRPYRTETGKSGFFDAHYSPLRNSAGEVVGGLVIIRDITGRKRGEQKVKQLTNDLEHASRLSVMGEMAAGVAHELHQPLAAIANYANGCRYRLKDGRLAGEDLSDVLGRIDGECQRAGSIVRRIRDFIEKREPLRRPVDINEVVQDAMELVQSNLKQRNVRFEVAYGEKLQQIKVDPVQITQVVLNLLLNAVEAMDEAHSEHRRVDIETRAIDENRIGVSVSDNGPGIPAEQREHIFEQFVTTKSGGLGLGLSISRSIVERHGGKLEYDSNSDGGATFRFSIPTLEASLHIEKPANRIAEPSAATGG